MDGERPTEQGRIERILAAGHAFVEGYRRWLASAWSVAVGTLHAEATERKE